MAKSSDVHDLLSAYQKQARKIPAKGIYATRLEDSGIASSLAHIGFDPSGGDEATVIVHHVAPAGWKLVPIEPTERMLTAGFESEPREGFSEPEVWEAFQMMSGCQQAAHKARLCWSFMIDAAPTPHE